MPEKLRKWEYEALDSNGLIQSDIVEAADYRGVIEVCVKKGLYPRDIRELSKQAASNYGQLPRLKALKERLEAPAETLNSKPGFSQMLAPMASRIQEEPRRMPRLKLDIDWSYLGFVVLIALLIFGSQFLK